MAKIGLIDVDSHNFPNYALMKISSFHKQKGDDVEFVKEFSKYDKVYKSKVFTFSNDDNTMFDCSDIVIGGTGYDLENKLPIQIENIPPDYSLYPEYDYAVGYLTRGCPRGCPFCIVGEKEGYKSYKIADLNSFYNGQNEIKLLDPNLTACKDRIDLLTQLKNTGAKIDFTQGLDIRFMTNDVIYLILQMNVKMLHFAYDRMNQKNLIEKNLINFRDITGYKRNKVSVFVLVNFETTLDEDLYRLNFIRELNFQPYVMVYEKDKIKRGQSIYLRLQRWVNNPRFFWKYESFDQYQKENYKRNLNSFEKTDEGWQKNI